MLCHELEENLTIYLDGSLTPRAQCACSAHLLCCAECLDLLSAVKETIQACRTWPTPEPPATLTARIMRRTAGSLLHFEH
jgi:anti-sigma factor RsiW